MSAVNRGVQQGGGHRARPVLWVRDHAGGRGVLGPGSGRALTSPRWRSRWWINGSGTATASSARSSPERTYQRPHGCGGATGLPDPQAHAVRRPGGALYRLPHPLPIPQPHHRPRGATGQGRTGQPGELQLLCGACNSKKGTGTQAELVAKLKKEGIR